MDYQNGKIYRIVCEETGRQYIGSTCSTLVKRLSNHKRKKECSSKDFINPKIFLIEDYSCDRKDQLLMRERFHIENTECVNLYRPIIYEEERQQENKVYFKQYHIDNREQISINKRLYYEKNRENIVKNKNEKITCECGSVSMKQNLTRHKRSKKHKRLLGGIQL